MKNLISISLLALFITGSAGCAKKPEGSTGKMADLYSALHDVVMLNRQYKAGKVNQQVFEIKNNLLNRKIVDEFAAHRDDVWAYSLDTLSKTPIDKTTRKQVSKLQPVAIWPAVDKWNGDLTPLPAMFSMLPMQMTLNIIQPGLTPAELNNMKYAFRPVQLLQLDNKKCTTAFLFGIKIITVDFTKQNYRWKPTEIRIYFNRTTTTQPKKSSKS